MGSKRWSEPQLFAPESPGSEDITLTLTVGFSPRDTHVQPWVQVTETATGAWIRCETVPGGPLADLPAILGEVAQDLARWALRRTPPFG